MRRPLSFFHRLLSLPTRPRTPVRRQLRTRLGLESLEDRLVPANVLTISGDQLGANYNDHVTINATSNGGLMVTLNGQTTTYGPGQISSVSVNAGGGSNTIDILGTPAGTPINVDSEGTDTVTVGNTSSSVGAHGSMNNIKGAVDVFGNGEVTLNLDDSGDSHGQTVALQNGTIYYGTAAAVYYSPTTDILTHSSPFSALSIYGGSGGNTFNVYGTDFGSSFDDLLSTGMGNDTVNVYSIAAGDWGIENPGGKDNINMGLGNTANLNSFVFVSGVGSTSLNINDSSDTQARTVTIYQNEVNGLGAGGIGWYGVSSVQVDCGSGGNTINVETTSESTYLKTGTGNDTVNISATTAALNIENPGGTDHVNVGLGNMSGIKGNVDVFGAGATYLNVDDSSDTTARIVTMNDGSIYGLGGTGIIKWTPSSTATGGVIGLGVEGGSGGNTFNVVNTSNFYDDTFLNTGAGNDTVKINAIKGTFFDRNTGGADTTDVGLGSVANINGFVKICGIGSASLLVDDHLDSVSRTFTLTSSQLTGLGNGGIISYGNSGRLFNVYGNDLMALTIDGGSISSIYNIQGTGVATTVNGGIGNDTFNLGSGNSLNGIQAALTIHGGGGTNTLNAIDTGSATGQSYTLSATQLTRSGIAAITYASLAAIHATASGNDTLTLLTPVPTVTTTFNGGIGTNTLHGANVSNTWTISGPNSGTLDSVSFSNFQQLIGGNTNDTFKFTINTAHVATIGGGFGGSNTLDYSALGSSFAVRVNLETGSASLITSGFGGINAVVGSSDTANTLIGANINDLWTLTAANTGTITNNNLIRPFFTGADNSFSFTAMPHLVGGTGVDSFKFANTRATVLSINGGGAPVHQGDWLDYSSLPSSSTVTVNLATGSATNVNGGAAGAVTGIQNVIGSASGTNNLTGNAHGNILIGGSGANTLTGGSGNSLLIGGSGHGSITGGIGQDILIAGTTTYNAATAVGQNALMSILAELQSTDTFAQKVSDLINGNNVGGGSDLNGGTGLTWGVSGATVGASTGAFKLSGNSSAEAMADWFFSGSTSTISDFDADHVADEHNNNNVIGVF